MLGYAIGIVENHYRIVVHHLADVATNARPPNPAGRTVDEDQIELRSHPPVIPLRIADERCQDY